MLFGMTISTKWFYPTIRESRFDNICPRNGLNFSSLSVMQDENAPVCLSTFNAVRCVAAAIVIEAFAPVTPHTDPVLLVDVLFDSFEGVGVYQYALSKLHIGVINRINLLFWLRRRICRSA